MIGAFRNFAKTKFAGILVFIMIIPFVFWGMGSMFSSGNTNSIVKINETNISTEEFIDYLNNSGIPQDTIRENLNDNINLNYEFSRSQCFIRKMSCTCFKCRLQTIKLLPIVIMELARFY